VNLAGAAALVTGSATGIGRATALALARRGCHVVVNYTRSEAEAQATARDVEALGARALLHRADVAADAGARAVVAAAEGAFGRLDVLVNAAGTTHFAPPEDLEAITPEIWDRIFDVNVRGTFLVTRAAAPSLKRSGRGAVVNLASIAGLRPAAQVIPYAASKADRQHDRVVRPPPGARGANAAARLMRGATGRWGPSTTASWSAGPSAPAPVGGDCRRRGADHRRPATTT
jgi:3-oxoacyl-[acyl-carrier protein] reductase